MGERLLRPLPDPRPLPGDERSRRTSVALIASSDVFESFFDRAPTGLALAGLDGRFVRVNAAYAELVGRPVEDLVGVELAEVVRGDGGGQLLLPGELEAPLSAEVRYLSPDGRERWVLHGVTTVPGPDGRPGWLAVSAQDITERRRAEEELRDLAAVLVERAVRDPLTGLANRALLEERARAALARAWRTRTAAGVLFLDLDGFKQVNDEHGHAVGDAVLRVVAERLQSSVRPTETVARLGGDEFVVLVEDADDDRLTALELRLTSAVGLPVVVGDLTLDVGVSTGRAIWRAQDAQAQGDVAELLATADLAMYADKERRRSARGGAPGARSTPGSGATRPGV